MCSLLTAGQYKFKANMHERFSHQHQHHHHHPPPLPRRQRSGSDGVEALAVEMEARRPNEDDQMGKRRRLLSEGEPGVAWTGGSSHVTAPPDSSTAASVSSPLRLLSFAASSVDTRVSGGGGDVVVPSYAKPEEAESTAKKEEEEISAEATAEPPQTSSVPVFALHPSGSYYVPLSIDRAAVAPYLVVFEAAAPPPGGAPVLLHPVTINVNFSGPVQVSHVHIQMLEDVYDRFFILTLSLCVQAALMQVVSPPPLPQQLQGQHHHRPLAAHHHLHHHQQQQQRLPSIAVRSRAGEAA
jgi:hypothetical protein